MSSRYPFKFLNAYDSDDTDIFFGRDEEIELLYEMVFQTNILLVYGGSGTGKTSLVNCGLASRFQSHDWLDINIRRGRNLNDSLREKLELAAGEKLAIATDDFGWLTDEDDPQEAPIRELSDLERRFRHIYLKHFKPVYLIFDQFEELYVIGDKAEQQAFIQTVKEILKVDQPVKMIFIIREEYLGHLFDFEREVPELLRKKLRVEAMNRDKVKQVILGATQAKDSNIQLKNGEADAIAEGIFARIRGDKKSLTIPLPYLQVFLDKLYLHITGDQERQMPATFSLEALSGMGNIGDVLRDFLEEQAYQLQEEISRRFSGLPEDTSWQILSPFVTLEGTKEPMGTEKLLQRLPALPPAAVRYALQSLENRRILRYDDRDGLYEIAHDSLALRIAERRSDEEIALLEIRRLIKGQISLKEEARALLTEKQLNFIDPYRDRLALTTEEQQLIDNSRAAVAAQKAAAEQEKRAKQQRLQRSIAVLVIFSLAMIALAVWALGQQSAAKANAKTAGDRLLEIEKQRVIAIAQELEGFGDSYRDLGKTGFACDSYRSGLDSLEMLSGHDTLPIFKAITLKYEEICE